MIDFIISKARPFEAYVGCAKWNKKQLQNFYPKGMKDEPAYYATQFNCIEFNASFYRLYPPEEFQKWYAKVPQHFRFFPKLEKQISHFKRLKDVEERVAENLATMSHLREKLEMTFLQMHDNFGPRDFDRVVKFVEDWTYDVPLAIEFRDAGWFSDAAVSSELCSLLETHRVTNIIIDTAGRRDLMHMRLTTPIAFIRWVGTNHQPSNRSRLDDWVERIAQWKQAGLQKLCFFVHEHDDQEVPALAAYFIRRLNDKVGTALPIPKILEAGSAQQAGAGQYRIPSA